MLKINAMIQSPPFFHLYCVNNKCGASIYKNSEAVEMPLTNENLILPHYCSYCQKRMVSCIEAEIEQLIASIDVAPHYNLNYN
jgi:hypothetical protein